MIGVIKKNALYLIFSLTSIFIAYILTYRYFLYNPDIANSPLVWRAFLKDGFSVFQDWNATQDNWYFTTFPINFLFFKLLDNDGPLPLIISTSLFISLTAIIVAGNVKKITGSNLRAFIALFCLTCVPAYSYTYAFLAHAFSHYSTIFYGAISLSLFLINIERKSISITIINAIVMLLTGTSDPWFLATFFLPFVLAHWFISYKKAVYYKTSIFYSILLLISLTHIPQILLGLPYDHFKLTSFANMLLNVKYTYLLVSKSINIFPIYNHFTGILSLIIWLYLLSKSFLYSINKNYRLTFLSVFTLLSILGILASYILNFNYYIGENARFFCNILFLLIFFTLINQNKNDRYGIYLVMFLYAVSALYSYHKINKPLANNYRNTLEIIDVLQKNQLTYGYSEYWHYANNITWLSYGKVEVTSLIYNENYQDYSINFKDLRLQSFRSHFNEAYAATKPKYQFIMVENNPEYLKKINIKHFFSVVGQPVKTLKAADMLIYVYDKDIFKAYHKK